MLLLYLPFLLVVGLGYVAAMGVPVLAMATLGRVGAALGVVILGFAARAMAGSVHHVWASQPLSFAYLPFFAGVAWALWYSTRPASPGVGGAEEGESSSSPLRGLVRSPMGVQRLMSRNLLALTFVVVPVTVVLNYAGEYLQRVALGQTTQYLELYNSWDYAKYFEGGPFSVVVVLFLGGLLYEGALLRLPPAASTAAADRRALAFLPLMLAPWLVLGGTSAIGFHSIALTQGLVIYFFLVRRFPAPDRETADALPSPDAALVPTLDAGSPPTTTRRRWRYAVLGGAIGGAVAGYALVWTGLEDSGALAIAAEQMFFLGLPASLPLRSILVSGGALQWQSSIRLASFVLAAPMANGILLGWALARGLEALRPMAARHAE